MGRKKKLKLEIVNPNAGGIDVGSRSHFVSIGQSLDEVKEFGVYAEDLKALSFWLLENNIDTVAIESTGDYWQNLHAQLLEDGIEVVLVNGKFTKNIKGKKTDVLDCMWIQKMHSLGLLSGSFLPDDVTMQLRTYCRQRLNMLRSSSQASAKMQKYLKFLNFRLDVVVSDVCGLTGMKIITAICAGNLDPKELAKLRHYNCRKSEEEIEKALHGNNRKEYLFGLSQEFESYKFFKKKIEECEEQIKEFLETYFLSQEFPIDEMPSKKPYKRVNKNAPKNIDLNVASYQYFGGVDLMAIEGVSHATLLTLMSEIGPDGIKKFDTALRNAANAIGNLREGQLAKFFKRIAYKKGRQIAITATARKLAIIIWKMVTNKEEYKPTESHMFLDEKRKLGIVKRMKKKIAKLGITNEDLGLTT